MKFPALCKKILIPLFLPYTLFIGCSVIGAIAGGASHPGHEGKITSTLGLDSIEVGTEIRLVKFNRATLEGTFNGLAVYPGRLYALTYDTLVSRSAYKGFVPRLNQEILLRSAGGTDDGFFKGIYRGAILFRPASGSDTIAVPLDDIEWLQASDSSRLTGTTARKLVRDGTMLGRELILLECNHEYLNVPYESIEMVELKASGSGALTGFLIGAAVDIIAVVLIVNAEKQTEADCNSTASSCSKSSCSTSQR